MAKPKGKELYQFCILETYVTEVLGVHKDVTIDEITFEIGFSLKRVVSTIPARLAELGVTYLREPSASMEAQGMLTGSRTAMKRNATDICHHLSLDVRHMRVKRMTVSFKGTRMSFTRMTKRMEGEEGKTHQLKVLGLVVTEGNEREANHIIKLLGAKKFKCQYGVQTTRTVICTI